MEKVNSDFGVTKLQKKYLDKNALKPKNFKGIPK